MCPKCWHVNGTYVGLKEPRSTARDNTPPSAHQQVAWKASKANLTKGGLVLCIKGHTIHTGKGKPGEANHGWFNKYAAEPQVLYFCTSKDCTLNHVFKRQPASTAKLQYFCMDRANPRHFVRPVASNINLQPGLVLTDAEKAHLNSTFATSF